MNLKFYIVPIVYLVFLSGAHGYFPYEGLLQHTLSLLPAYSPTALAPCTSAVAAITSSDAAFGKCDCNALAKAITDFDYQLGFGASVSEAATLVALLQNINTLIINWSTATSVTVDITTLETLVAQVSANITAYGSSSYFVFKYYMNSDSLFDIVKIYNTVIGLANTITFTYIQTKYPAVATNIQYIFNAQLNANLATIYSIFNPTITAYLIANANILVSNTVASLGINTVPDSAKTCNTTIYTDVQNNQYSLFPLQMLTLQRYQAVIDNNMQYYVNFSKNISIDLQSGVTVINTVLNQETYYIMDQSAQAIDIINSYFTMSNNSVSVLYFAKDAAYKIGSQTATSINKLNALAVTAESRLTKDLIFIDGVAVDANSRMIYQRSRCTSSSNEDSSADVATEETVSSCANDLFNSSISCVVNAWNSRAKRMQAGGEYQYKMTRSCDYVRLDNINAISQILKDFDKAVGLSWKSDVQFVNSIVIPNP